MHKVHAFIAPKLIGGAGAPTPLGELGFTQMDQAIPLCDTHFSMVGLDLLCTGYLPSSGGLAHMAATAMVNSPPTQEKGVVQFYKAWDAFGALSNFSPHPIRVEFNGASLEWRTVEV